MAIGWSILATVFLKEDSLRRADREHAFAYAGEYPTCRTQFFIQLLSRSASAIDQSI